MIKRKFIITSSLLLSFFVLPPPLLHAGWFSELIKPPASQLDYPTREVERPVTLAKGWASVGLGFTYTYADVYYDDDGHHREGTYSLEDSQWRLVLRYGWTRNLTLGFSLPYHIKDFDNDNGFSSHDNGLGDGSLWATYQVFHHAAPRMASVALRLRAEVPTGEESPGSIGNISIDSLIFGRGTYALALSLIYKQQLGIVALETEAGYNWRIPGTVQFVVGSFGESGRVDFGDEVFGRSEIDLQVTSYVSLNTAVCARYWGTTSQGIRGHLDDVEGTDGWELHIMPGMKIRVSPHWELDLAARLPVGGENTNALFPLTYTGNAYHCMFTFLF